MPHIHGVAWISQEYLASIGITGELSCHPEEAAQLAEKIMSCNTSSDDLSVNDIAKEVQYHKHTKSCRKYGTNCRYGFPRLPSRKTLVATPLDDAMNEDVKQAKLKKFKDLLERARELLESPDIDEEMSFDDYLKLLGVSDKEYHEAIGTMSKGYQLILKRSVKDRYINNFCPEWLKA